MAAPRKSSPSRPGRVAIYTRVSTRQQAEKHGTSYQREALEKMAEARGWTVVGTYTDEGYSGRRQDRPGLADLMKSVRRGQVDVVAIWRFDRLARSLAHLVTLLQELDVAGVELVSHTEAVDTSTPLGRALFAVAGAMGQLESDLAKERAQAGLDAARARGIRVGRPRATLTVDEAMKAVTLHGGIRPAARALGVGVALVARRLREGRIETPTVEGAENGHPTVAE